MKMKLSAPSPLGTSDLDRIAMEQTQQQSLWHRGLADPSSWAMFAAPNLMHAADMLWTQFSNASDAMKKSPALSNGSQEKIEAIRNIQLCTVAFMLAAFAVENLLKGLWIKKMAAECAIGEDDKRLKKIFDTHNLVSLAMRADISCDANRRKLLERLQTELLWGGRYPRPKNAEQFHFVVDGKLARSFLASDWISVTELYNELYLKLRPSAAR